VILFAPENVKAVKVGEVASVDTSTGSDVASGEPVGRDDVP
jgi:hypothetical protein